MIEPKKDEVVLFRVADYAYLKASTARGYWYYTSYAAAVGQLTQTSIGTIVMAIINPTPQTLCLICEYNGRVELVPPLSGIARETIAWKLEPRKILLRGDIRRDYFEDTVEIVKDLGIQVEFLPD